MKKSIPEIVREHMRQIGRKGGKAQPIEAKVKGGKNSWKSRVRAATIAPILLACAMLCGCEGSNAVKCRQAVVERYGGEVQSVPGNGYMFIVRDTNGAIWYVQCNGFSSAAPTAQTKLFDPQR